MKAEHRKELETNILADKMGKFISSSHGRPSRGVVFYAVIGLVAALAVFLVYRWYVNSATRLGTAWYLLEDGAPQTIEQMANSTEANAATKAARFQVAYETLWLTGMKQLGSRPKEAMQRIQMAEEIYRKLAEACKGDPIYEPEALYALAVIEETRAINDRTNLVTALEKYKAVTKLNKDSAFAKLAQERVEALEDDEKNRQINRFYQDLEENLRRTMPRIPGLPGLEEGMMPPDLKK
jgi:hypothetical protein